MRKGHISTVSPLPWGLLIGRAAECPFRPCWVMLHPNHPIRPEHRAFRQAELRRDGRSRHAGLTPTLPEMNHRGGAQRHQNRMAGLCDQKPKTTRRPHPRDTCKKRYETRLNIAGQEVLGIIRPDQYIPTNGHLRMGMSRGTTTTSIWRAPAASRFRTD
jgi:hypothetical protein